VRRQRVAKIERRGLLPPGKYWKPDIADLQRPPGREIGGDERLLKNVGVVMPLLRLRRGRRARAASRMGKVSSGRRRRVYEAVKGLKIDLPF